MTAAQRINIGLRRIPSWLVYLAGGLIPFWYLYLAAFRWIDPAAQLAQNLGYLAVVTLVIVLAVTPLRKLTNVSLVMHRRALGLLAFFYVVCHFLVWMVLDVQDPSRAWADIVKRPYITIGMAALILLLPVAATSNDYAIRKLGPKRWRRLHQLTYVICVLAGIHYVMMQKIWEIEPLVFLAIIVALLATRLPLRKVFVAKKG